jgi:hypothetical protein
MAGADVKLPQIEKKKYHANKYQPKTVDYKVRDVTDLTIDANNQKEINMVLEAIQAGYLVYPSFDLIWSTYAQQPDFNLKNSQKLTQSRSKYSRRIDETLVNDFTKILYLNLRAVPIIELGDIPSCTGLTHLILSDNYLVDLWPLAKCVNLVRLDLQNNHVSPRINNKSVQVL